MPNLDSNTRTSGSWDPDEPIFFMAQKFTACEYPYGGFQKNGWFIMENPIKIYDLGEPLFQETTISYYFRVLVAVGTSGEKSLHFLFSLLNPLFVLLTRILRCTMWRFPKKWRYPKIMQNWWSSMRKPNGLWYPYF